MSYRYASEFLRKAKEFLDLAELSLDKGYYDLAVFNAHQATELFLKGILLKVLGTFPRTHDLVELIEVLSEECEEARCLLKERMERLEHLTDAYFTTSYVPRKFRRDLAELFVNLASEVMDFVGSCEETKEG